MSKSIDIDQSHSVIQALVNNVDWSVLDGDILQTNVIRNQKKAGEQFTLFLKNGAKSIFGEPKMIEIDRSVPFDPTPFIKEWVVEGEDERSRALTDIDLAQVLLMNTLSRKEETITGKDNLSRLKRIDCICLDAQVFKTLWDNKHLIPLQWLQWTEHGSRYNAYIFFEGTILRHPNGTRSVFCLFFNCGKWHWNLNSLSEKRWQDNMSAVLSLSEDTSAS